MSAASPNDSSREVLDPVELLERFRSRLELFKGEVSKVIVGQERVVDELLIALLSDGHSLLEGVPGLAKTLLIRTVASALSLDFGRIQFTPDLMPTDVTGSVVIHEDRGTGERHFTFRKGPIFVNVLLADEINRTPPKTQAALLEGMSERQVTTASVKRPLPKPFFVLATQNPIEQEGTFPLPEAQLDRFLLKIVIDYPVFEEEFEIVDRTTGTRHAEASTVLSREEILALQKVVRALPTSPHLTDYATRLVRASRPDDTSAPAWVKDFVAWGAGPRAAQALILAAKAHTLLRGRVAVTRGDIRAVAFPVLRHRILPSFRAEGEGLAPDDLVARLLLDVSPFPESDRHDPITRKILRL